VSARLAGDSSRGDAVIWIAPILAGLLSGCCFGAAPAATPIDTIAVSMVTWFIAAKGWKPKRRER
jgi:hypothetical protein